MAPPKQNYRDEIAAEIIARIEAGTAPWQKPWKAGAIGAAPFNPISGNPYRGINDVWLTLQGRADPRWLTYNQAVAAGGQVRKGEKSTTIEYWQWTARELVIDGAGKPVLDANGQQQMQEVRLDRPRVFYAKVFNASQIDGLQPWIAPAPSFDPIERAEALLSGADVRLFHDQADRAFYRPGTDSIHLPPTSAFPNAPAYYETALHELGHASGHQTRLARAFGPFGSEGYAREELRAEISSYMLARELGISFDPSNHAAYVESWLHTLREDKNEIFRAAKDAEIIKTWVMEPERRLDLERAARQQATAQTRAGIEAREQEVRRVAPSMGAPTSPKGQAMEIQPENRIYISVPFGEKNDAKNLGAKWDGKERKSWYIPAGVDPAPFSKWMEKQPVAAIQEGQEFPRTIEYSEWRDLGAGYSLRQSTTHPRLDVRTPEGNVLIRGFQKINGKPYEEFEFSTSNPLGKGSMAWVDKSIAELTANGAMAKVDTILQELGATHFPGAILVDGQAWWNDQSEIAHERATSDAELKADLEALGPEPAPGEKFWVDGSNNRVQPQALQVHSCALEEQAETRQTPEMKAPRTYLAVPFAEKDEVKKLGAKWSNREKSWYITPDHDPAAFAKWSILAPAPTLTPEEEFAQALKAAGLELDASPVMDGEWHRVPVKGDKGKETSGMYRGFLDGRPAGNITNYKAGQTTKWVSTGVALTEAERARIQAQSAQVRADREAQRLELAEKAAKTAYGIWANLPAAATPQNCPYLAGKGVSGHGVKITEEGKMVVPCRDAGGKLWNVQFVDPDGKHFLKDSLKTGTMHVIDPAGAGTLDSLARYGGTVVIVEGYATGSRIYEAVHRPVVVAFDSGNLKAVAEAVKVKYPDRPILIAADNDHANKLGNVGQAKAEEAAKAVGGYFVAPKFTAEEMAKGLTDFDDLGKSRGNGAVRGVIESALSRINQPERNIA